MPDIECFGKNCVKFKNGKSVEIDAILFTTGFLSTCSFLDEPEAIPFPGKKLKWILHNKVLPIYTTSSQKKTLQVVISYYFIKNICKKCTHFESWRCSCKGE